MSLLNGRIKVFFWVNAIKEKGHRKRLQSYQKIKITVIYQLELGTVLTLYCLAFTPSFQEIKKQWLEINF